MFRGFKVSKGIEFERAVKQIEPELCKDYRGTSPRKLVPGTEVSHGIGKLLCTLTFSSMCSRHQRCPHFFLSLNIWRCLSFRRHQGTSIFAA